MGRIRGKRNRDQDRYTSLRRSAEQSGMVGAERAVACTQCGGLMPPQRTFKGWCLSCVESWTDTVDPWILKQAAGRLPESVIAHSAVKEIERLQDRIIHDAPKDEAFLPLTQFFGSRGVGASRAMWNFLQALYVLEVQTTGDAARLGVVAPNTVHLCGRHAPVQRMSIQGFLSRIQTAGADFKLWSQDGRFVDYIRGFASDNRLFTWTFKKTGVDVYDRHATQKSYARYGTPHFDKHTPSFWPFEGEHDGRLREKGALEELPDVVMQIGQLVPLQMPASLREDLCQDLVVAVLSGETTFDELRNGIKHYIREAFRHHPLKYGRYSLDQPTPHYAFKGEDYMQRGDALTHEDTDAKRASRTWLEDLCIDSDEPRRGWHEGHDRPVGMTTVGEVVRHKHDGHAIDGPNVIVVEEKDIDADVREVFEEDTHPQWRRRFSAKKTY